MSGSYQNIIGIDPGLTGAIAMVTPPHGVADMPVVQIGKKNKVSPQLVAEKLKEWNCPTGSTLITIEDVHAMPGQGVSSMFNFGRSLGVIEGVVAAMGYPILYVTPQSWKKWHGLAGKDKDASRQKVMDLSPMWASQVTRKKDVGRADAILIGMWGRHAASTIT